MLTRDHYIAILEKRAADESAASYDAVEVADKEIASNSQDNKAYLGTLFDNTSSVQRHQTKQLDKLLPGKTPKETAAPLIKAAARELFDSALSEAGLLKTASPAYREVAFRSFCSELEKLGMTGTDTTMHDAFRRVNGGQAARTFHVADPMEMARAPLKPQLAPKVQAMRAAKAKPGLLSRAIGALGFGR